MSKIRRPVNKTRIAAIALVVWGVLVLVGRWWLIALQDSGRRINYDDAAPLVGSLDWHPSWRLVFPVAVAVTAVAAAPYAVRTLRWRPLIWLAAAWSALWSVVVAVVDPDGWDGLTRPLLADDQYLVELGGISSLGEFVANFTERIPTYVAHVSSHPPGMLVVHWAMDRVGLGGAGWAAVLCIGAGAASVAAVLVTVREVAGEEWARSLAPFLAVAPIAIWVATTADAFFTGVGAWAVAGVVLATSRRGRDGDVLAFLGGLGFGIGAFLSYGLVLLALVPTAVALARGRVRPLLVAAAGAGAVFVVFALAGFWWPDGLDAAHVMFYGGVGGRRPYGVFLVANWSIIAVALGPALAVAIVRLRDRASWLLVGGALAAVTAATLSGYSKGEVERIWLPFAVWLLVACGALAGTRTSTRTWLAVQAAYTIVLTTALRTPW